MFSLLLKIDFLKYKIYANPYSIVRNDNVFTKNISCYFSITTSKRYFQKNLQRICRFRILSKQRNEHIPNKSDDKVFKIIHDIFCLFIGSKFMYCDENYIMMLKMN